MIFLNAPQPIDLHLCGVLNEADTAALVPGLAAEGITLTNAAWNRLGGLVGVTYGAAPLERVEHPKGLALHQDFDVCGGRPVGARVL